MPSNTPQFPIPEELLPNKLKQLLGTISSDDPKEMVIVSEHYEHEKHTDEREYCHMLMASIPEGECSALKIADFDSSNGVVISSEPVCDEKGQVANFNPSVSGYDYIVASWGDGSFYTSNLAEKVWMSLGLSQRCIGNAEQYIIFDDLSLPLTGVAKGSIAREYYYTLSKNAYWEMRNDYLRKYLWMRGHCGVRVFFYETSIEKTEEVQGLLDSNGWYNSPEGGWYDVTIQPLRSSEKVLLQVSAVVMAVEPEKCSEINIEEFVWPGDNQPMTKARARNSLQDSYSEIYVKDKFLQKYEQNSIYSVCPLSGVISYKGQWSTGRCGRLGRSLIQVEVKKLYEGTPSYVIDDIYQHAVTPPDSIAALNGEPNVAKRAEDYICTLLDLGDALSSLGQRVGVNQPPASSDYIGLDRSELNYNGWWSNRKLSKIGHSAPLDMTEDAFLSRCKSIAELLIAFKDGYLRNIVLKAGIEKDDIKEYRSIKLLKIIFNLSSNLAERAEDIDLWPTLSASCDWNREAPEFQALFVVNALRQVDAHEKIGEQITLLEELGFDSANLSSGYGLALDFVFDQLISSLSLITQKINSI